MSKRVDKLDWLHVFQNMLTRSKSINLKDLMRDRQDIKKVVVAINPAYHSNGGSNGNTLHNSPRVPGMRKNRVRP